MISNCFKILDLAMSCLAAFFVFTFAYGLIVRKTLEKIEHYGALDGIVFGHTFYRAKMWWFRNTPLIFFLPYGWAMMPPPSRP